MIYFIRKEYISEWIDFFQLDMFVSASTPYFIIYEGKEKKRGINYVESEKEYELVIFKFPIQKAKRKRNANKKTTTNIKIEELVEKLDVEKIDIEKGSKIFCPVHENKKTSKTPSAKISLLFNTLTCYSTQCTLPLNKYTGYRQIYLDELMRKYFSD